MKKSEIMKLGIMLLAFLFATSCEKDESAESIIVNPGNDPNFTIVKNTDQGLESFIKKVVVFEIPIYAVSGVKDEKLLHAANVMAQYLDNDEDGQVDDQNVIEAMKSNNAFVVMWKKESDLNIDPPSYRMGQDLGDDETEPNFVANACTGSFDASLEEILHIISNAGYASAYPDVFGTYAETELAKALDIARGGHYDGVPNSYTEGAWFTYDDNTCEYDCQATEYLYWAMTSYLGAQKNRLKEIGHEWKLNTKEKLTETDVEVMKIIESDRYILPTILPDGTYRR